MTDEARRRILVVDDDDGVRGLLNTVLLDAGYAVECARDGAEALRQLQAAPPELVITDLVMPDVDGTELIRAAQRRNPELPIIAISGGRRETRLYMRVAEKLGAAAIVDKPFDIDELLAIVATHLPAQS